MMAIEPRDKVGLARGRARPPIRRQRGADGECERGFRACKALRKARRRRGAGRPQPHEAQQQRQQQIDPEDVRDGAAALGMTARLQRCASWLARAAVMSPISLRLRMSGC
jgi:hypothetical protein